MLDLALGRRTRMPEAMTVVARLHDVAVVSQAIKQRRCQLGIAKHRAPFGEVQVGGDHHAGVLVEPAEQVKQQGPASLAEG